MSAGGVQPRFSVIIAAYQAAAFVGGAIRSALEQKPPPHEVVIGDDGSTDDLRAELAPFEGRVRAIRIDHAGEAAAKNAAAAAATGDFLAFLDADDRFLPGRLQAMGALAAARPDFDVITTDAFLVHEGRVLGRCYGGDHRFVYEDQRAGILRTNFVLGLSAVRRSVFENAGGFDTGVLYTTDWELWIRLIFSGSRVGFIPDPLAEYVLHPASSSARRILMSEGRIATLERAAARTDLTPAERAIVGETRRREAARLQRELLKDALARRLHAPARRSALRVLGSRPQPLLSRLKALAALAAPAVVGRRVRADAERDFVTVGDRRLPRR